jgi:general secretion pathway protein I
VSGRAVQAESLCHRADVAPVSACGSKHKHEAGFTLLEVLVATAIMAIAVVGVFSGLTAATRNAARITQYDRATMLARQVMDALLADNTLSRKDPIAGRFPPAQSGGVEAGWRARVTPFEKLNGAGPGSVVVDRIELEIWWMDGATRRSFSLEGYRRGSLRPEDFGPEGLR